MISERPLEETLGEDTKQNKGIGIRCFAAEPQVYVTADEDARVLKKIDRCIMPIMFVIYFLQYMDKQTLSFSSVFGIIGDAHLTGREYSLLGSIVLYAIRPSGCTI